jgi:hypothetical protein
MHELLGVVAYEVSELGIETTLSEGVFPAEEPDDIYVVVPHEYFIVMPPSCYPSDAQRRRTIAFCVEHPGNVTFERTARWASVLGRAVDINEDSTAALRSQGIPAERFTLGYSRAWDTWHGDETTRRDIDVAYLGTTEPRRSRALASYAELFAPYDVRLLMPPHEWKTRTRPDFLMGRDKFELLRDSRILLNLHRGDSYALEWVRVLEALCNGCVVVSEHSIDFAPLVPGDHVVFGHWRNLGQLTDLLLREPESLAAVRRSAYEFLMAELPMRPSAARLVELADGLASATHGPHRAVASIAPLEPLVAGVLVRGSPRAGAVELPSPPPRAKTPDRPALARSITRAMSPVAAPRFLARPTRQPGSIDVLIAQGVADPPPVLTIASVADQQSASDLVIRVALPTDALPPGDQRDRPAAGDVISAADTVGASRNGLLMRSDAEYVLVLEPIDTLLLGALPRLIAALELHPNAAAAYPLTAEPDGGIGNKFPLEASRLAELDYLGAPALWRRDVLIELGGWYPGADLEPLENYDLWRRLAAVDGEAHLVPQILVRRRFRPLDLVYLADVDRERAERLIDARCRAGDI